jgi:hypothetical protein
MSLRCCHITQAHYTLWLYKHLYRHSRIALPAAQRRTQSLAQYILHTFLFAPQLRKDAQVYLALKLRIMILSVGLQEVLRSQVVLEVMQRSAVSERTDGHRQTVRTNRNTASKDRASHLTTN